MGICNASEVFLSTNIRVQGLAKAWYHVPVDATKEMGWGGSCCIKGIVQADSHFIGPFAGGPIVSY